MAAPFPRHRPRRRGARAVVGASIAGVTLAALVCMPAAADPARTAPPARTDPVVLDGATDAMNRLADLGRKSEQTNEALHNAQIELDAKQAAQAVADERVAQAQVALDEAEGLVAQYRPTVDKLALANYQGARTNRLFAVMVSDSPQQLLDQMSALDVIAQQTSDDVGQFADARVRAQQAADEARSAADAARAASDAARVVQDELGRTKADLERQIGDVTDAFDSLTDEERLKLAGSPFPPGIDADAILAELLPGSGSGALQAAMTRIGSPYVWGATGPDSFDCSGLVVWAYQQVGKTLPRSSQAQAAGGTPISRDQLQPGDVVIIYDDASHVGLYAGNGNLLHASTFGVPVKVESLDGMDYAGARRY